MPYRKRIYRRKRPLIKRRRKMMRKPRSLQSRGVYSFKRTFEGTPISSSNTEQLGAYTFQFAQLPNYTEFTTLFDQYKINAIRLRFVPNVSESSIGSSPIPDFHTVLDYTDGGAPASKNAMLEYPNWKMTRGTATHTRFFYPTSFVGVLPASGVLTAGDPKRKQWHASDLATVTHYGLKYCIDNASASPNIITWSVYATFYFQCKSVR